MDNFDLRKYLAEGRLLKEDKDSPKGIILSGGAAVGKSYVVKNILGNLDEKTGVFTPFGSNLKFKYMNPDDLVEKKGLSLGAAMGEFRGIFQDAQDKKENIIWDTTGANIKNTMSQLSGYDKFMVMVYTHPIISILQNIKRDRKLPVDAVLKTWDGVYSNIEEYKNLFKDNFVLIQNNLPGYKKDIQEFNTAIKGGKDKLNQYLENLVSTDPEKFKSSFSTDFSFDSKEIEQAFTQALSQTSFNEKVDGDILKLIQKEFQKEYLKKNEDPGSDVLEKKIKSARNTVERNNKNKNENLEGIVNKLTSSNFEDVIEPTPESEIKSKLNSFLNE
jgi:hypothetical protein